jgi:hypothetical protein
VRSLLSFLLARLISLLYSGYSIALYLHRFLESSLAPAFARRVLGTSAWSQIIVGGSNFGTFPFPSLRPPLELTSLPRTGELLGAASVFVLAERVPTPLPWLRLDALAVRPPRFLCANSTTDPSLLSSTSSGSSPSSPPSWRLVSAPPGSSPRSSFRSPSDGRLSVSSSRFRRSRQLLTTVFELTGRRQSRGVHPEQSPIDGLQLGERLCSRRCHGLPLLVLRRAFYSLPSHPFVTVLHGVLDLRHSLRHRD